MPCGKTLSHGQNRAANIDLSLYPVSWRIQVQVIARRPFPGRPFTSWGPGKMEANDVENLHAALCHHLPNFQALLAAALAHVSLSSMVRRVPL